MTRKILHVDLDAFFCAVEELLDPSLKGKAFAVGGNPERRGVVSTCSYLARSVGIHSAMPMAAAIKRCPGLIIVHGKHNVYSEKSRAVMRILGNCTPLLEQVSVDEAFLDVSDLPQPGLEIARTIQNEVNIQTELPCSLGIATNKLVAKIANNLGKKNARTSNSYPNALNEIPPGTEAAFLAPLPVAELWGVGKESEKALARFGIRTIGQLASYPTDALVRIFGNHAVEIQEHALGIDNSLVDPEPEIAKSVSQETTFDRDVEDKEQLLQTILHQSEQIGFRMRRKGLNSDTIRIKIRWSDFTTITRQVKINPPTNQDSMIYKYAQTLFETIWQRSPQPVRLIGTCAAGIEKKPQQLSFFDQKDERQDRLLQAVDEIKLKYGKQSLKRGFEIRQSDET